MGFLSANIAVCETVIWEQPANVPTLVRVMTVLTLSKGAPAARFFVITAVTSQPGDVEEHTLFITLTDKAGNIVASTDPTQFIYGYKIDPSGPGGFNMTTEVNLEVAKLPTLLPCHLLISAFLDEILEPVAATPLLLQYVAR
jgi:hypothetical protein